MASKLSKTKKTVLLSVLIIVFGIAAIVTVLVLTLSDKDGGMPHIKIDEGGVQIVRGELDISLMRERLETLTYDKDGLPVRGKNEALTDFSKSNKNIFGIDENIIIAPECYFKAEMAIANKKPYAFEYWIEIIPENGESLLVDQLELTVEIDGETVIRRTLQSGLETEVFPKVNSGKTGRFTVKLEYLSLQDNDKTKNTTLTFDMVVHARLAQS